MGEALVLIAQRLLPLLVGFWLLMWSKGAPSWFKSMLHAMNDASLFVASIPTKIFDKVTHHTAADVTRKAQTGTGPVTQFLQGNAHRTRAVNNAHAHFAEAVAGSMYRMRHNVMPTYVHGQVRPAYRRIAVAQHTADVALGRWKAEQKARQRSIDRIRTKWFLPLALAFAGIDAFVKRPHAHAHHHAHTHTLPGVVSQTRQNTREIAKLKEKLTKAAIAAAVAYAIARVMPSWRCSNFKNFARKLRCSHWKWLDDLLFGALALISVVDPVVLAREAVAFEDKIEWLIKEIAD